MGVDSLVQKPKPFVPFHFCGTSTFLAIAVHLHRHLSSTPMLSTVYRLVRLQAVRQVSVTHQLPTPEFPICLEVQAAPTSGIRLLSKYLAERVG